MRVEGKVKARNLRYLGPWNADGSATVSPGTVVIGPDGQGVLVPQFSPALLQRLVLTPWGPPDADLGTTQKEPLGQLGTTRTVEMASDLGTTPSDNAAADCNADPIPVRPYLLPDGSWGVLAPGPLAVGDLVMVTTSYGEQWTSTVTEVLEPIPRGMVARTTGRPQRSR